MNRNNSWLPVNELGNARRCTSDAGSNPWAPRLNGGFSVLELASHKEAVSWAARIAKACRCDQQLRVFQFDPQS
jgi:hypothetical protein